MEDFHLQQQMQAEGVIALFQDHLVHLVDWEEAQAVDLALRLVETNQEVEAGVVEVALLLLHPVGKLQGVRQQEIKVFL